MPIFKIIGMGTGLILTVAVTYAVQKKVGECCNEGGDFKQHAAFARMATTFATSVAIGGVINKVINKVFK